MLICEFFLNFYSDKPINCAFNKNFVAYTPEPEPPRSCFLPGAGAARRKKEPEPQKWGGFATLLLNMNSAS